MTGLMSSRLERVAILAVAAALLAGQAFAAPIITGVTRTGSSNGTPVIVNAPPGLLEDSLSFVDRTHEYNNIPGPGIGAEYVRVANNDKTVGGYQLDVTLAQAADLYIMLDSRVDGGPSKAWMFDGSTAEFRNTLVPIGVDESGDGDIDNNDIIYIAPNLPAGTYSLFAQNNGGSRNMYGVAATAPAFGPTNIASASRSGGSDAFEPQIVFGHTATLGEDMPAFVDRTHEWNEVPTILQGAEYLMIANDDRGAGSFALDVTVTQQSDLFLMLDNRVGRSNNGQPNRAWMQDGAGVDFKNTLATIGVDESGDGDIDNRSTVFIAQNLAPGTYTLLQQGQGGTNMYGVAVAPTAAVASVIGGAVRRNGSDSIEPQVVFGGTATLGEDSPAFVDRTHQWNNVPAFLKGAEYVMIANDDKTAGSFELDVTLDQPGDLYVMLDNRVGKLGVPDTDEFGPVRAWMFDGSTVTLKNTFVDIGVDESADGDIDNTSRVFVAPNLPAGTYTLFAQNDGGSRNMYGVAATELASDTSPIVSVAALGRNAPEPLEIAFAPTAGLREDSRAFSDRTHEYNNIPDILLGAEYILMANDDKTASGFSMDVTLAYSDLYLMIDNRVGIDADTMEWVGDLGFVDTGEDIGIDEGGDGDIDQTSSVYVLEKFRGTITLLEQNDGGSRNMYGVAAVRIPEPATLSLLGLGALALARRRRRR